MTPRQISESLGKPLGAIADPENPYLDEYFVGGTPLSLMFKNAEMSEEQHGLDTQRGEQQLWMNDLITKLQLLQNGINPGEVPVNSPVDVTQIQSPSKVEDEKDGRENNDVIKNINNPFGLN